MPDFFISTTNYVVNASGFWRGIGWTVATSIFIGATLYNGDLKQWAKGMVSLGTYAFFILLITSTRLIEVGRTTGFANPVTAHAGIFTLFYVSVAYFTGLFIGVLVSKYARRKHANIKSA